MAALLQGVSLVMAHRLLIVVSSLVVEPRLYGGWASVVVVPGLSSTGSVAVVHRLSCSAACGIFPDQGLNLCPLHCKADPEPLDHHKSAGQSPEWPGRRC